MTKKNNKNNKLGLLQKKISEITEKDWKKLEILVGTDTRPYPMFGTVMVDEDGHQSMEQRLGSIRSKYNSMRVYSEKSYDEVIGMLYRDMPTPSMLPMQKDILEMIKPTSKNRIYFMKGDPGSGKSFLGGLIGRVQSDRPVDIYDCGGKNMNDVLFEMVLDFGTSDALPEAIDKRIQAHALQPLSYALLKNEIPSKYITETEDKRLVIDWEGLKTAGTDDVIKTYETLKKVSSTEGLDSAGGNALGMNSQYGRAIRDFIEGNLATWDEYNKSKEGTDNALQTFLQFVNGEIDECTVVNPLKNKDETSGPSEFTFKREDVKAGWGLILTGNAVEDGTTTRSLNKSVYSRLTPVTIPKPTLMDWQHRICQIMTGLPISTLYSTYRKAADANPDKFTEMLMHWRTAGLSEDEKANIPQIQISLIKNWKNVLIATEKLAEFYQGWAELTDPDLAMLKDGNLVEEIDEEYQKEVSIDFRKVIQHIQYAMPIRPAMSTDDATDNLDIDPNSWTNQEPEIVEQEEESLERNFGTRLTNLLAHKIYETAGAVGKPALYGHLEELMKKCGIKDLHLQEGAYSNAKSVESALNISLFDTTDLTEQIKIAQDMFCDYIRSKNPDITADNENIITVAQMKEVLDRFEDSEHTEILAIPNTNPENLHAEPFIEAKIINEAKPEDAEVEFTYDDLIEYEAFMTTLALPKVGDHNLKAVWDRANNLGLLVMRSSTIDKQNELEAEVEVLKNSNPPNTSELIDKQKELLDFMRQNIKQLKALGGDVSEIEAKIKEVKQGLIDSGVAVEDDITSILPPSIDEVMLDDDLRIAENNSDTGIGATSVVVKATNDNGDVEAVPVHIIVNNNSQKTLVVSNGTSKKLSTMFREVGIAHVDRTADNAKEAIREALDDILRGTTEATRLNVKSALTYRNEPQRAENMTDRELSDINKKANIEDILHSYEPYFGKYLIAKKSPRKM